MTDESRGPKIGSIVADRYQLTGSIASGANGDVFRARHIDLETVVAVKVLRANLKEDPEALARLKREAQALNSVRHSNVVGVTAVTNDASIGLILVMELLEGQTLSKKIESSGRLSLTETLQIMAGICSGLDAIHLKNIVHRDLKPSNVMLARTGGESGERPVLIDFGLVMQSNSEQRLTSTNAILGTPLYMSPEQGSGAELDSRTDIYSLSCILYEMLSGAAPFRGETVYELMMQHMTEEPAPIRFENEDAQVSKQVNAVIAKGMAKDPDARFQSGAELLSALQRASSGQFKEGGRIAISQRPTFYSKPIILAIVLTALAGLVVAYLAMHRESVSNVIAPIPYDDFKANYSAARARNDISGALKLAHEQVINSQKNSDYRPTTMEAWAKHVDCLRELGRLEEAKRDSRAARQFALENHLSTHSIDLSESDVLDIEGDYQGVVNCLYQYKGKRTDRPYGTFQRLGEALLYTNRAAEAIECADAADEQTDEPFEKLNARILKGAALVAEKKYDAALSLLKDTAEAKAADRPEIHRERLLALLAIACKHLNKPDDAKMYGRLALASVAGSIQTKMVNRRLREERKQAEIREMLGAEGLSEAVCRSRNR